MQESDLIITCRIGQQEVLLPINHIYNKILIFSHVFLKWLGALNVELMSYGYNNLLFRYIER